MSKTDEVKRLLRIDKSAKYKVVKITPSIAKTLVEKYNVNNRPISPTRVKDYKKQMEEGNWQLNTDAIGFDKDGMLMNGQHRLTALSQLNNITLEFPVIFNIKRGVNTDTGLKRNIKSNMIFADNLDERLKNRLEIGDVATAIYQFSFGYQNSSDYNGILKICNTYADDLIACYDAGLFSKCSPSFVNSPSIKAAYFTAYKCGVSLADLVAFKDKFVSNTSLSISDKPATKLFYNLCNFKKDKKGGQSRSKTTYNMTLSAIDKYVNGFNPNKAFRLSSKNAKYVIQLDLDED